MPFQLRCINKVILINLFSNVKWQFCVYSFFVQNINFDLQFCAVGKWENGEASEVVVGRGGGGENGVAEECRASERRFLSISTLSPL